MLYRVPDPRLAAAEAARVIRDDGLFVATTNSSDSRPDDARTAACLTALR